MSMQAHITNRKLRSSTASRRMVNSKKSASVIAIRPTHEHSHCGTCIQSSCRTVAVGDGACTMVECEDCRVRMHKCKVDEHRELCCPKAYVPCINAQYGCGAKLRREKLGIHLEFCAASTLICCFVWNREFMNVKAKKELKQKVNTPGSKVAHLTADNCDKTVEDGEEAELDIQLALSDQRLAELFFACKHQFRRAERDGRIPLRIDRLPSQELLEQYLKPQKRKEWKSEKGIVGDSEEEHSDGVADNVKAAGPNKAWVDSSEEEEREMERKVRIKRGAFADCYLCQQNPGSQHLHVLGNMAIAATLAVKNAKSSMLNSEMETDWREEHDGEGAYSIVKHPVMASNALGLKLDIAFGGAISQSNLVRSLASTTLLRPYTLSCGRLVRRDEFAAHQLYHQRVLELLSGLHIRRCPMWAEGCTFWCSQLRPSQGKLKPNKFVGSDAITWESKVHAASQYTAQTADSSTPAINEFNAMMMDLLEPYLDSASMHCLSATCRKLRTLVFTNCAHRTANEVVWRRILLERGNSGGKAADVHWMQDGIRRGFSSGLSFPIEWTWEPVGALSDHMGTCAYLRPTNVDQAELEPNGRIDLHRYHGLRLLVNPTQPTTRDQ